jgi:FkbM family methyltransferase
MSTEYSPLQTYLDYLLHRGIVIDFAWERLVESIMATTNWDQPESASDYHNNGVIALIEAEKASDLETRRLYLDHALESINASIATQEESLATSQWSIVQAMLGNSASAAKVAYNELIMASDAAFSPMQEPVQLVYLPGPAPGCSGAASVELLPVLLQSVGLGAQRVCLSAEALCRSQLVLYGDISSRALHALDQMAPGLLSLNRKIGIYKLANQVLDGFLPLYRAHHQACETSLDKVRSLTALELANRAYIIDGESEALMSQLNEQLARVAVDNPGWQKSIPTTEFCRYVPFDDICMAVEPTLKSIVTQVLLAEGDWFEREMELWRYLIKPGMTVIDVGANSGVYTFSAAKRVGPIGHVIAIEPFQGCVDCLNQTRLINEFNWVQIVQAAASNLDGEIYLQLHAASEFNEVILDEPKDSLDTAQKVARITLDSLIYRKDIEQLDLLKIDAEGHEVEVIEGAEKLINEFAPLIIYENLAGSQKSNLNIANILIDKGYSLARFEPWSFRLIPVNVDNSMDRSLNIIAIPEIWADRLQELV